MTEYLKGPTGVGQFKQELHKFDMALQQTKIMHKAAIPVWLRPFVNVVGPWPEDTIPSVVYETAGDDAYILDENDHAPEAGSEQFRLEMHEGFHIASKSRRMDPKTLRRNLATQSLAAMVQRPTSDWLGRTQRLAMDVATAGAAYNSATNKPTAAFAAAWKDYNGQTHTMRKPTETATVGSATIANANHLVQWPDRSDGLFAAGHSHIYASLGAMTAGNMEDRVHAAKQDIIEHPNQNMDINFVGASVKDIIDDNRKLWRGGDGGATASNDAALAGFMEGSSKALGATDFGMPEFIGNVRGSEYWYVKELPDDIHVTMAAGTRPLIAHMGIEGPDGAVVTPSNWVKEADPEIMARVAAGGNASKYGFSGYFTMQVQNPVGVRVAEHGA